MEHTIDKRIARAAAQWSVRLHPSAQPTAQTIAECEQWRGQNVLHELAWQRAQDFNAKFGVLPHELGKSTLNRSSLPERRRAIKVLAAAIIAAPAGWYVYANGGIDALNADHRTAKGERRRIQLADGTLLHLNTDSAIDVAFSSTQRVLSLRRGEVYIQTARDAQEPYRPFIVKTQDGVLRALGTAFSVRQQDGYSDLAVFEHAVEVSLPQSGPSLVVNAGQRVTFTHKQIRAPEQLQAHASAWKNGLLYAFKTPLPAFVNELSRYRRGWIKCHPALVGMEVSGSFQLDDTEHVLEALTTTLPIKITFYTRYWVSIEPLEA